MIECKPPQFIPVEVLLGGEEERFMIVQGTHNLLYIQTCTTNSLPGFYSHHQGALCNRAEEEDRNQQLLLCALR